MAGRGAIVDIDGTLVDTNYQHTLAWGRAFADNGVAISLWRLHRHNGMGGDQLVAAVAGDDVESRLGDAIRASESGHYHALIDEVRPLPGASDLLAGLRRLGYGVVLASSAKQEDLDHYLDLLEARELVDAWTSEEDVEQTKPKPDLVSAAMAKLTPIADFIMIGDATWDAIAAARVNIPTIGLLSGGFGEDELRAAGCRAVYADAADLAANLDDELRTPAQATPAAPELMVPTTPPDESEPVVPEAPAEGGAG
jgi:phosphoglycolate phosphatase-like HAD superfamily hydrolase